MESNKLTKILEKLATTKVIIALIILCLVAFFVYRNFDFITEITFKVDRGKSRPEPTQVEKAKQKKIGTASIEIRNVQLSPVDFKLPNYFYFELHNNGSVPLERINLTVDLGKANLKDYEIRSSSSYNLVSGEKDSNIIKMVFDSMNPSESVYVYTLLTSANFKKIVVNSDDITNTLSYSIDDMAKDTGNSRFFSSGMITFFKIIFALIVIVFVVYAVIVVISNLNRVFKIDV